MSYRNKVKMVLLKSCYLRLPRGGLCKYVVKHLINHSEKDDASENEAK